MGDTAFSAKTYLDVKLADSDPRQVEAELKFATNVTSRQHDRQNFFWAVKMSSDLDDGHGEVVVEARSHDFEYVARQLKEGGGSKSEGQQKKSRVSHKSPAWEVSDSDVEAEDYQASPVLPPDTSV